jgi:hypothetical protein
MKKNIWQGFVGIILIVSLSGCGGSAPEPEVEIGYQPPIIPVRVSINSHGELNVGLSGQVVTPIGVFDIGGGVSIDTVRENHPQNVLIVRVDGEAVVYELEEGKAFNVTFDDNDTLYQKVALNYETNGDIVLELESAPKTDTGGSDGGDNTTTNNSVSCPGAKYPTRLQASRDAQICTQVDRLIIRKSANMNASEALSLYPGTTIRILEGPVCANDFWWWKVEIYPGTTYGLQDRGFDPLGTTDKTYYGWAREGWDEKDSYFICQ